MSAISLVAAQEQFTATLSAVEDAVKFAFRRRLRPQEYEEALAEARAAAWSAWHGLVKRGKDPVAVGVHGIATNAIRYVRNGRKLGAGPTAAAAPWTSTTARPRRSVRVQARQPRLRRRGRRRGFARGVVAGVAGRGQPGQAGRRGRLPGRLRGAGWRACPSGSGGSPSCWPRGTRGSSWRGWSGCSPGRVSQVRAELEASWRAFQGQAEAGPRRAAVATG